MNHRWKKFDGTLSECCCPSCMAIFICSKCGFIKKLCFDYRKSKLELVTYKTKYSYFLNLWNYDQVFVPEISFLSCNDVIIKNIL